MSAPLELTSDQLRDLAYALASYARIANQYGVFLAQHDPSVSIDGHTIRVRAVQDHGQWSYRRDAVRLMSADDNCPACRRPSPTPHETHGRRPEPRGRKFVTTKANQEAAARVSEAAVRKVEELGGDVDGRRLAEAHSRCAVRLAEEIERRVDAEAKLARVEALLEPHHLRDSVSGTTRSLPRAFIKARHLRSAIDGSADA